MSAAVIGFLCFLAGAAVLGFVFFGVLLLRGLRQLNDTLAETNKSIPMLLGSALKIQEEMKLSDAMTVFGTLGKIGLELGKRVDLMVTTLNSLQKAIFKNPENPLTEAPTGDSAFFTYSDQLAALREQVEVLKKKGYNVDELSAFHPTEEQAVNEEV